ncbi:hypothetical protein Hanom_Chr12g01089531 [Helianthus anomalus]
MASSVEAAREPFSTSAVLMSASKHISVRCREVYYMHGFHWVLLMTGYY